MKKTITLLLLTLFTIHGFAQEEEKKRFTISTGALFTYIWDNGPDPDPIYHTIAGSYRVLPKLDLGGYFIYRKEDRGFGLITKFYILNPSKRLTPYISGRYEFMKYYPSSTSSS